MLLTVLFSYCPIFVAQCSIFLSTDKQFLGTKFIQECLLLTDKIFLTRSISDLGTYLDSTHPCSASSMVIDYVLKTFPNSCLALHQEISLVTETKWNLINITKSQSFLKKHPFFVSWLCGLTAMTLKNYK